MSVKKIIEELPNGKSTGIGGVTYEMLKYCSNNRLIDNISLIFEKIIRFQQMPYLFNISILKPIVKDIKKTNKDIGNLLPIAVSDALSNLFEAVLLNKIERQYFDHKKQF